MAENGGSRHGSLSDEILSLVESDTRFWNDTAERCEHVAGITESFANRLFHQTVHTPSVTPQVCLGSCRKVALPS